MAEVKESPKVKEVYENTNRMRIMRQTDKAVHVELFFLAKSDNADDDRIWKRIKLRIPFNKLKDI